MLVFFSMYLLLRYKAIGVVNDAKMMSKFYSK